MLIKHNGKQPQIHETAYIAPNATICGDVTIGENSRVMFGAIINGDEGKIEIGDHCILMESTIIKGVENYLTQLKNHIFVGARAYLTGCVIEDCAIVATGATVLNNSIIGAGAEIGINSVVYVNTNVLANVIVPIGHIALGKDPTYILPTSEQGKIWHIARTLNFFQTVWEVNSPPLGSKESIMPQVTNNYARGLVKHKNDEIIE